MKSLINIFIKMNLVDNQLEKDITLKELFELIKPEIIKNLFQTFNFNDIQERKQYFQNHLYQL